MQPVFGVPCLAVAALVWAKFVSSFCAAQLAGAWSVLVSLQSLVFAGTCMFWQMKQEQAACGSCCKRIARCELPAALQECTAAVRMHVML